ncbi:hypothetical protein TNCV_275491 [Trichonephila clavipes]|nr:hypothetical protein TNCV_275491 [Trichonephila clavipes]
MRLETGNRPCGNIVEQLCTTIGEQVLRFTVARHLAGTIGISNSYKQWQPRRYVSIHSATYTEAHELKQPVSESRPCTHGASSPSAPAMRYGTLALNHRRTAESLMIRQIPFSDPSQ